MVCSHVHVAQAVQPHNPCSLASLAPDTPIHAARARSIARSRSIQQGSPNVHTEPMSTDGDATTLRAARTQAACAHACGAVLIGQRSVAQPTRSVAQHSTARSFRRTRPVLALFGALLHKRAVFGPVGDAH